MTPRERIIATLQHKEPDRVPVDLGATESSGITWKPYNKLKKHFGINTISQIFDLTQLIVKVEPDIVKIVGSDAIPLLIEPREWKQWEIDNSEIVEVPASANIEKLLNGDMVIKNSKGKVLLKLPQNGFYFDSVYHPLKDAKTIADIDAGKYLFDNFDWPYYCDESYEDLSQKAKELYEKTNYAIVGNLWVHLFAAGQELRGFENFMMDLVVNKKLAHKYLERQVEAYLPRVDKYIEAIGPYVQVIQVNDDLGTQSGSQIGLGLYQEMIKPYHKKLWQYIKKISGKPILFHSCGSIYEFLPDLIEIGVNAINPVQVSAKNMDTKKLKREFGKDLVFWGGGCDSQKILPFGTPKDVREEVKRRVSDLAPGGGFVFCQVHNIQPDVSLENILAMYEELENSNLSIF